MIFRDYQAVLDGEKIETRRPKSEGECLVIRDGKKTVLTGRGRVKWQVGRHYAIQPPGRGKRGVGRFELLAIWEEKVQDISFNDMLCEGYPIAFYSDNFDKNPTVRAWFISLWDDIWKHRPEFQWAANPPVWVLLMEV